MILPVSHSLFLAREEKKADVTADLPETEINSYYFFAGAMASFTDLAR